MLGSEIEDLKVKLFKFEASRAVESSNFTDNTRILKRTPTKSPLRKRGKVNQLKEGISKQCDTAPNLHGMNAVTERKISRAKSSTVTDMDTEATSDDQIPDKRQNEKQSEEEADDQNLIPAALYNKLVSSFTRQFGLVPPEEIQKFDVIPTDNKMKLGKPDWSTDSLNPKKSLANPFRSIYATEDATSSKTYAHNYDAAPERQHQKTSRMFSEPQQQQKPTGMFSASQQQQTSGMFSASQQQRLPTAMFSASQQQQQPSGMFSAPQQQ